MSTETKTKRQKTVFSGFYDIAHIFANEPERNVKCRNGFVQDNIIYSYGYHFPIAKRHYAEDGKETIFFTLKSYSNTTSKHISAVWGATAHLDRLYMIDVPGRYQGDPYHTTNIEYWVRKIKDCFGQIQRARDNKNRYLQNAINHAEQLEAYIKFFRYRKSKDVIAVLKEVKSDKWEKHIEEYEKLQEQRRRDPVYQEKLEKARAAREKKELTKHEDQITKWRNFEAYSPYIKSRRGSYTDHNILGDLLRYNQEGGYVETSQRVRVAEEVAHLFYRHIQVMLRKGGCKSKECCDYRLLDQYTVTEISEQRIVVGCHRIKMEEVNNIAKQLKWI
jgi:hypothetical protein